MTLSIDTQSSFPSETQSVRTHSFVRRFMVEPSILPTNLCEDPRQGVGPRTIPSCITESSPSMRYPILIRANYMTKPRSHMGVNVVAQIKIGCHSTRTLCIFHKHLHPPFLHFNTDISAFHNHTSNSKGVLNKQCFSHPIVLYKQTDIST